MAHPPQLLGFLLYHRTMRRDADALVRALDRGEHDEASLASLATWFERYRAGCEIHANGEDTVLWPELLAARPDLQPLMDGMAEQHRGLEAALAATGTALRSGDQHEAYGAARTLCDLMYQHLEHEEDDALPELEATFDGDALTDVLGRVQRSAGPDGPAIAVPFMLSHADDAEREAFLSMVPPPVRDGYEGSWRDEHAALHAALG